MTVLEAKKIIAVMMVSYPNFKPVDIDSMAKIWADMLSEYNYEQVNTALKTYILSDTNGFAPSIGQIVDKIQAISKPQELSEMEAWDMVRIALRNSGYNAEEEFNKLPLIVQKAVNSPSQLRTWALDENYNEQVVSSNFMRCYRTVVARENEIAKMPAEVRALLGKAAQPKLCD